MTEAKVGGTPSYTSLHLKFIVRDGVGWYGHHSSGAAYVSVSASLLQGGSTCHMNKGYPQELPATKKPQAIQFLQLPSRQWVWLYRHGFGEEKATLSHLMRWKEGESCLSHLVGHGTHHRGRQPLVGGGTAMLSTNPQPYLMIVNDVQVHYMYVLYWVCKSLVYVTNSTQIQTSSLALGYNYCTTPQKNGSQD